MIDGTIITVWVNRKLHWAKDNRNCRTACGLSWVRGVNKRGELTLPTRSKRFCRICAKAVNDQDTAGAPVRSPRDPAAPDAALANAIGGPGRAAPAYSPGLHQGRGFL